MTNGNLMASATRSHHVVPLDGTWNFSAMCHYRGVPLEFDNYKLSPPRDAPKARMAARKTLRQLKGNTRLQSQTQRLSVKKQASSALNYIHSWNRMQTEIRARRVHMVMEGHLKRKKHENQLKLEAKLQNVEIEWSGGPETMEVILARIHQREEAAIKRERAMAYAFSHQWRANSNHPVFGSGNNEMGKANWGWSWRDRWIAARPWESRVSVNASPKKVNDKPSKITIKSITSPTKKTPVSVKLTSPNWKGTIKARKSNEVRSCTKSEQQS
ncbi:hypothetical protein CQW23_04280 [Capsicum baccatum]|uniref:Protein IQ-DOMAIN 1 n=1 Tax=Capsicum baccatum TaxID=33114 RepID=A0A2G2XE79_CAPBA|nr:hypothetical protein CQW23_04280 [Capsicum baccatum]